MGRAGAISCTSMPTRINKTNSNRVKKTRVYIGMKFRNKARILIKKVSKRIIKGSVFFYLIFADSFFILIYFYRKNQKDKL